MKTFPPSNNAPLLNREINFLPYLLLFLFIFICYAPFVGSGFFFDDLPNLSGLNFVDSSADWLKFITSGTSGSVGRPVALLSFALQYNSWPNHPNHFQLINIAIHGANTVLVFILANIILKNKKLLPNIASEKQRFLSALIISLLWGLHPGNISSVLYIVQRMNLLAVFWGLLSLIIAINFLIHSNKPETKNNLPVFLGTLLLYTGCLLLSVLSKENGILFGGLTLVVYFSCFQRHQHYHRILLISTLFLIFTLSILLFMKFDYFADGYAHRNFTLKQRLLTQPWITLQYIYWFIWPDYKNYYFFHDDINLISNVKDWRFGVSIFFWSVLLLLTRLGPLYKLAIGWFIVSHLLESTIIPLEMVFEHRNYLSGIGLAFLALAILNDLFKHLKKPLQYFLILALVSIYTMQFILVANSWSSNEKMVTQWSRLNPSSTRLLGLAGDAFGNKGLFPEAESNYKKISEIEPDSIKGDLLLLRLKCLYPDADFNWETFSSKLNNSFFKLEDSAILAELMGIRELGHCKSVPNALIWAVIQAIKEQNRLTAVQAAGYSLIEARLCLEVGDHQCFISRYENAALKHKDLGIKETLYRVYGELYGEEKLGQYKVELELKIANQ